MLKLMWNVNILEWVNLIALVNVIGLMVDIIGGVYMMI